MSDTRTKILVVVEGERLDVGLMEKLFRIYSIDVDYEIVSYCTDLYTLYGAMFADNEPDAYSLLQVLKEKEPDALRKRIFDENYSDKLLVFDLDPQATLFTLERIRRMAEYFVESTDMGKLYINYPMVEAFYHMKAIPDCCFDSYYATLTELAAGEYKARVNECCRDGDPKKFATTRNECNTVIQQNIAKAWRLLNEVPEEDALPDLLGVLKAQLVLLQNEAHVAVLSTCAFFIPEYNPNLIR